MTERDFYDVLGVAKSASGHDIKEAYRRLAFEHHPDRNRSPEAEQRFKGVSEAYSALSDPEKRALYDALGPEKYDDPREVFRYQQEREAAMRETRDYEAWKSARRGGRQDDGHPPLLSRPAEPHPFLGPRSVVCHFQRLPSHFIGHLRLRMVRCLIASRSKRRFIVGL